jgi:hypothetical protein
MLKRFLIVSVLVSSSLLIFSQGNNDNPCKVLLKLISEQYDGDCKNRLAHGIGIARGTDVYDGRFKKGLPHGKGKYTWVNGNYYDGIWKDGKRNGKGIYYDVSIGKEQLGIWKNDIFVKEVKIPDYKVAQIRGAEDVAITENPGGVPGSIEIIFVRDGNEVRTFSELSLDGNSGNYQKSFSYTGFNGVQFPFEGSLDFEVPNRSGAVTFLCYVRFNINKEGAWKVRIRY